MVAGIPMYNYSAWKGANKRFKEFLCIITQLGKELTKDLRHLKHKIVFLLKIWMRKEGDRSTEGKRFLNYQIFFHVAVILQ